VAERICDIHKEAYPEAGECSLCKLEAQEREQREQRAGQAVNADEPAAEEPIVHLDPLVPPGAGQQAGDGRPAEDEGAESDSAAEVAFFRELEQIKEKGLFTILFFGFRTAGKTWLLHRIKQQLFVNDGIQCQPRFKAVKASGGAREELPATSDIEFHYVHAEKPFVLIDIPGEYTEHMLEWNFSELRMILAAMAYAKAMIIALPADVLLFGAMFPQDDATVLKAASANRKLNKAEKAALLDWAKAFRADNDNISKFAEGLFHLAAVLSFVRSQKIDPSDRRAFARVTEAAVLRHMLGGIEPVGGADGLDCPVFVAMTKADRVLCQFFDAEANPVWTARNTEMRERADGLVFQSLASGRIGGAALAPDPWATLRLVRPDLHRQMLQNFPLAKFDYVTAFYGHDGLPSLTHDHYEWHPQRGVIEVLDWIEEARALRRKLRLLRRHYGWAVSARHYVEGIGTKRRFNFETGLRR
jgi:hypothetical protein